MGGPEKTGIPAEIFPLGKGPYKRMWEPKSLYTSPEICMEPVSGSQLKVLNISHEEKQASTAQKIIAGRRDDLTIRTQKASGRPSVLLTSHFVLSLSRKNFIRTGLSASPAT